MKRRYLSVVFVLAAALLCVGTAYSEVTEGLVAYYPFDGNAYDFSGNENDAVVHGAVLTEDRNGNLEHAYLFDGVDDRIEIPEDEVNGLLSFSIAFWMRTSDTGTYKHLFSGATTSQTNELLIRHDDGVIALIINGTNHIMGDTRLNDNAWHQIVVQRSLDVIRLFINGNLDSTWEEAPSATLQIDPSGFWLGGDQDCVGGCWESGQQFKGSMDDIRIYNRALTPGEVQELYTGQAPPAEPGECTQAELDTAYENGKQFCIENPSACGIEVSGGGFTQADLDAKYQEGIQAGLAQCDNGECPQLPGDRCATFDFITNTLAIPCLDTGAVNYWLNLKFVGNHLEIEDYGINE